MNPRGPVLLRDFVSLAAVVAALAAPARAAEFRVSPIRLDFDRQSKTGALTVTNEGTDPLQIQASLHEWTQDAAGKDVYTESKDLVFFPRLLTVPPGKDAIVRVGLKTYVPGPEKTYRLFLDEIPAPQKAEGTKVALKLRFAVPLFVKPLKAEPRGEISKIDVGKDGLVVTVRNTGNVHFRIETIDATLGKGDGAALKKEIGGWYVLAGAARVFTSALTAEECKGTTRVDVTARSEEISLTGGRAIDGSPCSP